MRTELVHLHYYSEREAVNMWILVVLSCVFCLSYGYGLGGGDPTPVEVDGKLTCFGRNQEPACVHPCPPERTCDNRGILFSCYIDEKKPCENKCVCKPGFYKNPLGDCISEEQCVRCPGDHEYFACNSACDNVCTNIHEQNRTNCPIVNALCNEKCYCEDGFARDEKNNCVPVEKCNRCPGDHEYFACGSACDNVCANINEQNRTNCPIVNIVCNDKCYCEDGFARDDKNNCVPVEKCKTITCAENEEWSPCKMSCPPETCLSLVARFKCDSNEACKPRCTCKPGFLRLKDGAPCMPMRQCPELANSPDYNPSAGNCGVNEEYICTRSCPPDTCQSKLALFRCKDEPCQQKCRCKPGYLRQNTGTPCIPSDLCTF